MRTTRPGRRPRRDDRVCPRCGERGASHVAHHPSGMVVLCRACGHVHLALRMLGELPEPRADEDGEAAPAPAVPVEAPPVPDTVETVRALGQVVRHPRPPRATLLRSVR